MNKKLKSKKKALGKGLLSKTMIDQYKRNLYGISIPELPSFWHKSESGNKLQQYFNPSAKDYLKYGYLPNITVVKLRSRISGKWYTERVTIQASAAKIVSGTNYFGVNEKDFETHERKLVSKCNLVGLPINRNQLERDALAEIAFCFNFIFADSFPYTIECLKKMNFLDMGKRYHEVKNTDFIEEAHGYQSKFYNGQVGGGIYDERSRLINKARTPEEFKVVEQMNNGILPDKVARFEVTFQNQISVKQHLTTRLGGDKKQQRHLKEVFNNQLAQDILMDVFNKLTCDVDVDALEMPILPTETALRLCKECGMSLAEAMMWLGFSLSVQQTGTLPLKEAIDRHFGRQYRDRLGKKLAAIFKLRRLPKTTLGQMFEECHKQLKAFKIPKPNKILFQRITYGQLDLFAKTDL